MRMFFGVFLFLMAQAGSAQPVKTDDASPVKDALADSSCDLVRSKGHLDPKKLVLEYLERDGSGQFLRADKWFDGAALCPGHEPGPDSFQVITSYELVARRVASDRAEFDVLYRVAGDLVHINEKEFGFKPGAAQHRRKFVAWKTDFGWRLQGSLLGESQFVMPLPTLNFCKERLGEGDRRIIKELGNMPGLSKQGSSNVAK